MLELNLSFSFQCKLYSCPWQVWEKGEIGYYPKIGDYHDRWAESKGRAVIPLQTV